MQGYDLTLKSLLTREARAVLTSLPGMEAARWHSPELPEVRGQRADLLGETADGAIIHIELQSTNDPRMALRMLDYAVAIHRRFGCFPRQMVLYVGQAPLRMDGNIGASDLSFRCRIMDIRELDAEPLLASPSLDDNVISVLARMQDDVGNVRRILGKIAASEPGHHAEAMTALAILSGLRDLGHVIREETERMPILDSLLDHDLLGPIWKKGRAEGRVEGRVEGERTLLLRQLAKRFGPIPEWATQRLESLAAPELEQLGLRLLDAASLEELFS